MRRLLGWLALSACGAPGGQAGDRQQSRLAEDYAALIADPNPVATVALPACAALADPMLAGDCALAVVLKIRAREPGSLKALCPQVPEGAWRDECAFIRAEDALRARDRDEAAQACLDAGAFKHDCGQHLWQGELRTLVRTSADLPRSERLPRAQALFAAWEARLPATDIRWRFWQRYFEMGLETENGLNLDSCEEGTGPELRLRCRSAGAHLYLRRLWDHLHHDDERAWFCSGEAPSMARVEDAFHGVNARPDPLLEALLLEHYAAVCVRGEAHPPVDGVASQAALEAEIAALPRTARAP